jgi:flavin-dependent dehydrogenase
LQQPDLLVAGGGPAGSLLALLCSRAGFRVRLLDAAPFPRPKPCGGVLNPGATALLREWGLLPRILAAGACSIRSIQIVTDRDQSVSLPYGDGVALAREQLDFCLLEAAAEAGVEVWTRTRIEGIEPGSCSRPVLVRFRTAEGAAASCAPRWVAGAGGALCPVRRRFGEAGSGARGGWPGGGRADARSAVALSAVLEGEAAPEGTCEMHLLGNGYCGVAAAGAGRTTVGLVLPARAWRRLPPSPAAALSAALGGLAELAARLARLPISSGPWACGSLRSDPPARVSPGILLVGDALARMEPITGEGMAQALRGSARAARWLASHPDPRHAPELHHHQLRALRGSRLRSAWAAALSRAPRAARLLAAWTRGVPFTAHLLGRAVGAEPLRLGARRCRPDSQPRPQESRA